MLHRIFFLKGDIAATGFKEKSIGFTVCDQVIMHTEIPEITFNHLSAITTINGEFACYVYRKKLYQESYWMTILDQPLTKFQKKKFGKCLLN